MRKNLIKILLSLLVLNITACVQPSSPAIGFVNLSNDYIRNIEGDWNGYYLHGATNLIPGGTSSQNFNVESKSHIFGPVWLKWENAAGKKFRKDFVFKKEELPTYVKSDRERARIKREHYKNSDTILGDKTYARVNFYFTQDGVEYITSDNPNIEKIELETHTLGEKSFEQFRKKYPCWDLNEPLKTRYRGNSTMLEPNPSYDEELAAYNKKCKK